MAYRISQTGFVGGEFAPEVIGRTDLDKARYGLAVAKNVFIRRYGGAANRAGTRFVGEVKDSSKTTRIIPFEFSTTQTYVLEIGDEALRPIKDAGQVLESAKTITGATNASPGVVTAVGHGFSVDEFVYVASVGGMTQLNGRIYKVRSVPTADTITLKDLFGTAIDTTAFGTYTSGGTVSRLYSLTLPYDHTEVFDIGYAQTADTMTTTHLGYAVRKITRSGHASWSVTSVTFGPTQAAPTSPSAAATVGSGATTYRYKITALNDETGEESLPSSAADCTNDLTVAGNYNTITWSAATDASRYIVYKEDNGVYGLIGGTEATSFIDTNYLADLGDTPPATRNPFGSSSNYPAVCDFHEGRQVFGQTLNTPAGVWMSQSGRYENLNVSTPAKDDDAVSFQLRPGVNAIKGFASLSDLVVLTSEAEFKVGGGGNTSYITPASLLVRRQTRRGSSGLKPLIVGDITLYAQRQGAIIRAFGYSFEKDSYRGNDLTLLAPHLFDGHTIVDWCYQQDPHSIIWAVRDDGVLLSLTFIEDQNVFAWTRHYLGGTFGSGDSATGYGVVESCACIEGETEDEVYLVVKRTINSVTKRYIEYLLPRWLPAYNSDGDITNIDDAVFVDCSLSYDSAATTSISNLHHLEGQSVMGLADGNVVGPFTVTAGAVTLPSSASVVHLGLAYVSDVATLPVALEVQEGAPQGRVKAVTNVVAKFKATRGVRFAPASRPAKAVEMKSRDVEGWNDPIQPYTGDYKIAIDQTWDLDGSVLLRQSYPLPMELLALYLDVTVGQ